ncbi:Claw keratin, partial [Ophiophagus hannah]
MKPCGKKGGVSKLVVGTEKQYKRGSPAESFHQVHLFLLTASPRDSLLFHPAMAYCGPSCAVPSCASAPAVGFGSAGARGLGWGLGYGGLGYGLGFGLGFGRGLGYGYGAGALAETSGSLGTLAGVIPQPINQIPASEVTIQPPSFVITVPGPILSASCEPVAVGGYTPCAPGGIGRLGASYLGGRLGRLGRRLGGGLQGGSMSGLGGGLLGGGVSSGELGTLSGITPQAINQIPPAEIVIQPPSFIVTIPGPILSASCDPVAIGGNTPCAAPGSGILGRPSALSRGLLGGRNLQGGRGNVTLIPCGY